MVRGAGFFKNRSVKLRDGHGRSNSVEKKGWSSVKSLLCADGYEYCNSVFGENDSASFRQLEFSSSVAAEDNSARLSQLQTDFTADAVSVKSSEATVNQPVAAQEIPDKGSLSNEPSWKEKQNSTYRLFRQEDAAMTIQSAFRSFRARRSSGQMMLFCAEQEDGIVQTKTCSPDQSLGSSIKVQIGDSTRQSSVDAQSTDPRQTMHRRVRIQVAKLQEEWDDSTVSSNISKMRIQHRMEAATRRERALAYAFAQQLRVCAKKKRLDTNMTRSWLERWMATRHQPENSFLHSHIQQPFSRGTVEEESCGSNEVSLQFDGDSISGSSTVDYLKPARTLMCSTVFTLLRVVEVQELYPIFGAHLPNPRESVSRSKCTSDQSIGNQPSLPKGSNVGRTAFSGCL